MRGFLWTAIIILAVFISGIWVVAFRQNSSRSSTTTTSSAPASDLDNPVTDNPAPTIGTGSTTPTHFVPILMYHYVRANVNPSDTLGVQLSVAPTTLRTQLQTLKNAGYETISLNDLAAHSYKPKSLIITFDDGYEDQYTDALPILKSLGMTATFFIIHDFVGRDGYMTKTQITQLKSEGMELGGHSMSHKNLATMEYVQQVRDISGSLQGYDNVFCYPSGKYSPVTLDIVSGLGVKAAVTTIYGIATDQSKIYELPRLRIVEHTDILKRITEETAIAKKQMSPSQRSMDPVK